MRVFLTGASGFLGGYVAEACAARGCEVRGLVQQTCDTALLQRVGADIVVGDLSDPASFRDALTGCDRLIHTAGKVGDWGTWREFHEANVVGSRNLYDAAIEAGVPRAVHISSTAVYGKDLIQRGPVSETMAEQTAEQLPHWYFYGRSKAMGEKLAMDYHRAGKIQMAALRPGWVYGPRDHARLGALLTTIERGKARLLGDGSNTLMLTYVENVADAVLLAATHDAAPGQAFNVSNDEPVTQRQYFDALAEMLGVEPVRRTIAIRKAFAVAAVWEWTSRLLRSKTRPLITRQSVSLLALSHEFRTDKISNLLGWRPKVTFPMAIERIRDWWRHGDVGS